MTSDLPTNKTGADCRNGLGNRVLSPTFIRSCFYILAISLALIQIFANRFDLYFGDSISYLDMANYAAIGAWSKFINGYWSPLYPLVLAPFLKIIHPSPYFEVPTVKAINFIIYLAAIACFEFFLSGFIDYAQKVQEQEKIKLPDAIGFSRTLWRVTGYFLFLSAFLSIGGVNEDSPDVLMAALLLASIGFCFRIIKNGSLTSYACLGLLLGLAYLCKTVMLPISAVIFIIMLANAIPEKRSWRNLAVAVLIFTSICLSWILLVATHIKGYDPFFNSRLTYISFVLEEGDSDPGFRNSLLHPKRIIFDSPQAYEFASPVAGTYPLWYDPSYWGAGARAKFSPLKTASAALGNAWFYLEVFLYVPIATFLIAWAAEKHFPLSANKIKSTAIIFLPGFCALAGYLCNINAWIFSYAERYFIAFYILLTIGIMLVMKLKHPRTPALISIVVITLSSLMLILHTVPDIDKVCSPQRNSWCNIAEALRKKGIKSGDVVLNMGNGLPYWAEPYKLISGGSITDGDQFWRAGNQAKTRLLAVLKKAGFKAIVYRPTTQTFWQEESHSLHDLQLLGRLTGITLPMIVSHDPQPPADQLGGWTKVDKENCYFYIL